MAFRAPNLSRVKWYEKLGYQPRRGQAAMDSALDSGRRFASLFAFPRAGKSYGAARHVEPLILLPDNHGWIVAPKYELGSKEFGYIWNDFVETGILQFATRKHFDTRSGNMVIEFPWGSFVRVVSADNPSSLRAEELDWLILAEASALQENVFFRHLYARTEKRKGRVLIPTTPMGKNWVYDIFRIPSCRYDPNKQPNDRYDQDYWSVVLSSDPELIDEYDWDMPDMYEPDVHDLETVAKAKRLLPEAVFLEQFGGGFASFAGRVFPFDPQRHICRRFTVPDGWTHVVFWDHGASPDPTAILVGSYSPSGDLYLWHEIYTSGLTAEEYWGQVKAVLGNRSVSLVAVDPTAKQVRIELNRIGVASDIPHDRQVMSGIIRITALMQEGKFHIMEGTCGNTVKELFRYEWDEKEVGKPRKYQADHGISALRFGTLITVQLPSASDGAHPATYMTANEYRTFSFWEPFKKRMEEAEKANEYSEDMEVELNLDPFTEVRYVTGVGEEDQYEPEGGW